MGKKANDGATELVLVTRKGANGGARLQRARKNRFGLARQALFLMRLSETSNVEEACRAADVGSTTVYRQRNRNAEFAARWEQALGDAVADLKMKVAEQGRFGQTSECVVDTDDQGRRRVVWKRDAAATALRTLAQVAARTQETDADILAMNEARERQIEVDAAAQIILRKAGLLSDGGDVED